MYAYVSEHRLHNREIFLINYSLIKNFTRNRFNFTIGNFQRHEDHDNRFERGDYLSLPSIRPEWRIVVDPKEGIR